MDSEKLVKTEEILYLDMIKPLRGYVIIDPEKAEEKSAGGLYLPDNAKEKPQKGTILAVGSPIKLEFEAKKGDKVYYRKWGGDDINFEGKELKIVKFEDVVAII